MPAYETSRMFGGLLRVPVELVPLYAPMAIIHQTMSGSPANVCYLACYQLVQICELLGFEAEMWVACATVFRPDQGPVKCADVGVWGRPPQVWDGNVTDGHVVVWAESFKRLIDPTIVQEPALHRAAQEDDILCQPLVLRVPDRETLLSRPTHTFPFGPFSVSYMFFPHWISALNVLKEGELGEVQEYLALQMAHMTIELIQLLATRRDLGALSSLYPKLGALLAGEVALPALPPPPPGLAHYGL